MSPVLDDPCTPCNPKKPTLNDMVSMYEHSIQGKLFLSYFFKFHMNKLKILIVEGNTKEENINFG